jgi:hypothetical protein
MPAARGRPPLARLLTAALSALLLVCQPARLLGQVPSAPAALIRVTISKDVGQETLVQSIGPELVGEPLSIVDGVFVQTRGRSGQGALVPRPGVRFTGLMIALDDRVVTVRPDRAGAAAMTIPRTLVRTLERSSGRTARGHHMALGALVGAGAGAIVGAMSQVGCEPHGILSCWMLGAAASGAILGTGAGLVVGAVMPPAQRWVPIDAPIEPASTRPLDRVFLTFNLGQPVGGPTRDLERAMQTAGLDETMPGFFGSDPVAFPRSSTGFGELGMPVSLNVHYRTGGKWGIDLRWSDTPIGTTSGYRSPSQFLSIDYGVRSLGVTAVRHAGPLRVGIGPAWHFLRVRESDVGSPNGPPAGHASWTQRSRLGFTAEAGITLPLGTRMFFDLNAQYHRIGQVVTGPFSAGPGAPGVVPALEISEIPAHFSHWFIGFGPGVRF